MDPIYPFANDYKRFYPFISGNYIPVGTDRGEGGTPLKVKA